MPASRRNRQLLPIAFLVGVLVLAAVLVLAIARVRVPVPGDAARPGPAWPSTGQAAVSTLDGDLAVSSARQRPTPVASLTKIMTALVVLDRTGLAVGDEGGTVTITAADALDTARRQARSESVVALTAGDRLTQRQALLALLLPSAGNLAHVLAVRTAGSEQAFVGLMNARARGLGMSSTTYADVSGFDPASRSTARDQTVLARAALQNPTFAWLVTQHEVVLPGVGAVTTTNRLLGHRGFVGVKTGSTTPAGGCFVFAAHREVGGRPRLVVGAVLGQRGDDLLGTAFSAAERLVDSVTDRTSDVPQGPARSGEGESRSGSGPTRGRRPGPGGAGPHHLGVHGLPPAVAGDPGDTAGVPPADGRALRVLAGKGSRQGGGGVDRRRPAVGTALR